MDDPKARYLPLEITVKLQYKETKISAANTTNKLI